MTFAEQLREFLRRNATWFLAAAFALLLLQDVFGTHGVLAMRRSQKEAGIGAEGNRPDQRRKSAAAGPRESSEDRPGRPSSASRAKKWAWPAPANTFSRLRRSPAMRSSPRLAAARNNLSRSPPLAALAAFEPKCLRRAPSIACAAMASTPSPQKSPAGPASPPQSSPTASAKSKIARRRIRCAPNRRATTSGPAESAG